MKQFFLQFFTWWNGQTLGTRFHTWRHGEFVGSDESGNTYYRSHQGAIDPAIGTDRRWVIYNGEADASRVPPGWRGWMNHTVDTPPSEENYIAREWERPHTSNMTGTPLAWRPQGSTLRSGERARATGDYQPWKP
jgi:NADH:ubiquinone oxidoreductase subunit